MKTIFRDISKDTLERYDIDREGTFVFFFRNRNGKILFNMLGEKARVYIFGLYDGNKKQKFNLETVQRHCGKNSFSQLLIKSALGNSASFHFRGKIRVEKNARASESSLENRNLLCGKNSFADSRPELEISTKEVLCSHSAATSSFSESELLYMRFRGIRKEKAKRILKHGFLQEILQKVAALSRTTV